MNNVVNDVRVEVGTSENKWQLPLALTDEQMSLFGPAAASNRCKIGELILALACDRLEMNPASEDELEAGRYDAESALWRFGTGRFLPQVNEDWLGAGFPVEKGGLDHA